MKKSIKLTQLILLLFFLTSCKSTANKEDVLIKDSEDQQSELINTAKSKLEVRYSCGEDNISEFLDDGWIIIEEYSEEKICTWKSFPATKDCDMEKDKGCKITTPDKIGEEKVYLLEK
ncbi:alpha-2-macroglobulin [Prochlorococcus sp. AH-716-D22]|nr:alpha-2-macroglobulin [Prochlorococcus sp. AH-716-D22]